MNQYFIILTRKRISVWRPYTFLDLGIRLFQGYWAHANIGRFFHGDFDVITANTHGVIRQGEHIFDDTKKIKVIAVVCPLSFEIGRRSLKGVYGLPYDYKIGFAYQAWYRIRRGIHWLFRIKKKVKWTAPTGDGAENEFNCSKITAWLFNQMDSTLFPHWYRMSPQEIDNVTDNSNFKVLFEGDPKNLDLEELKQKLSR